MAEKVKEPPGEGGGGCHGRHDRRNQKSPLNTSAAIHRSIVLRIILTASTVCLLTGGLATKVVADNGTLCRGKLVPGLSHMAQGVDLTKLDLFPNHSDSMEDGFMATLIEWHCSKNKTWLNSLNNETYLVPDEVDSVKIISSGFLVSKTKIIKTMSDLRESKSAALGIKASHWVGSFSAGISYETNQRSIEEEDVFMAENKAHISTHKVKLQPAFLIAKNAGKILSEAFIGYLDELPKQLTNETMPRHLEMFLHFGTHIFIDGGFGGTLMRESQIKSSLSKKMDSDSIAASVQASFMGMLEAKMAIKGDTGRVDSRFESMSTHTERYFGGRANLLAKDGFQRWWPTVAYSPWLNSGHLVPITDLLPYSHPKKKHLETACEVYMTKSYLGEIKRSIKSKLKKTKQVEHRQFFMSLDRRVDQALESPFPTLAETLRIKQDMDDHSDAIEDDENRPIIIQNPIHPIRRASDIYSVNNLPRDGHQELINAALKSRKWKTVPHSTQHK